MAEGIACIGLPGDSGLFITAESATLVVAVIGRCGIAMGTGAECSCDTPLGGEFLLKGIVEFSDWIEDVNMLQLKQYNVCLSIYC